MTSPLRPESFSPRELVALYEGRVIGTVQETPRTAQLVFTYDTAWQQAPGAFPVSLSMPLGQREYTDEATRVVLWGILPDREATLKYIAQEHQVAANNPFSLLGVLGEDCPGALQFARPDRVATLTAPSDGSVMWLTEADLAARLRALRLPGAPARWDTDRGYFSLAGQQPKTALFHDQDTGRWGIPEGRRPTTHILKPPFGGKIEFLAAEHLSLVLANELGLGAAESFIVQAEDQIALAVVRYDRVYTESRWRRVHQEDICQALGLSPFLKYEREHAPGFIQIAELLWARSIAAAEDIQRLLAAAAFNWIIAGTDAHARNYSILIGAGSTARLAPFYDVASVLGIISEAQLRRANLAMQIGGEYSVTHITRAQWVRFAKDIGLDPEIVCDRIRELAEKIPDAITRTVEHTTVRGILPQECVVTIAEQIVRRAYGCARMMERRSS